MESRFQRIFLIILALFLATTAYAQEENSESDGETVLDAVINPDIERRNIDEDLIDAENFEAGIFAGVMSVEDFGTNNVYGVRFAYHVTEDLFLELTTGETNTSPTSYEILSGGSELLTKEQRRLLYYNMSLGWNILPGEVFIGKYAFNSAYYIIGGAGNTMFADNEYFTYNFGGGFRLFLNDWLAFRLDVRNHLFTHNILGEDKAVQNLETHLGLSLFF
ncbi:outer membrane beta-barrel protein [Alteromonadaceae bacterium 2753L.S.0a.02]|nr:outer membrane beta-barrel protein [Alteromonadaceae bacterium 2753L.S.0a.02]